MSVRQVQELVNLVKFDIVDQPRQFAAYFGAYWQNFLHTNVNPPFIRTHATSRVTSTPCFDANFTARELRQLAGWRSTPPTTKLRTSDILYIERQRRNLQALVAYWDAQFVPHVPTSFGFLNMGSGSGGATPGPGFTASQEFLKYRHVMTRPGGCPPPQIVLAGSLPSRYSSLRPGVLRLHRQQMRP